ncbi:hypothetical protein I3U40_08060 [Mycobacteroides abscessus subsp. abscessus]|uniref:hypothetical protein n=1 Tax=Mycobacteroides abscessus TaxID=36809 RepID=UPI0019D28012|nr:hypothetical protein [Mycobacteroides abscessus]QSM95686.1 hypothetical protein I3U31_08050 [Mycobacteroides abscessus subsp. abscessus]QSN00719.1 hypothetical protein I3U40_08060 [Mycobacteroides abscessus subsp. abscessus]
MTDMQHDDYPELPPAPLSERLTLEGLQPWHFQMPQEALEEAYTVDRAIRTLATRSLQSLGQEVVERARHQALLMLRDYFQYVLDSNGDVTLHD